MMQNISLNTQAILLLTAPLIAGRGISSTDILTHGEYKRLARHLREIHRQPADLLSDHSADIQRECKLIIEESRLQRLIARGFLLSHAIERWQARAIWVISRADSNYPRRLKTRLKEDAPAVLYGCGNIDLLETGGLAVVGSRSVSQTLIDFTMDIGRLASISGKTIVSGGARGIDQAAMLGALNAGGKVTGILADSLEKTVMNREQRNFIINDQLVLISPYDPGASFNVGNAMQRNKLIYALSDVALVVSSDYNKGGTWAGATEQLNKLRLVPVYVRIDEEKSAGSEALLKKGAIPWPNPQNAVDFKAMFNVIAPAPIYAPHDSKVESSLFATTETLTEAANEKSLVATTTQCSLEPEKKSPMSNIALHEDPQTDKTHLNIDPVSSNQESASKCHDTIAQASAEEFSNGGNSSFALFGISDESRELRIINLLKREEKGMTLLALKKRSSLSEEALNQTLDLLVRKGEILVTEAKKKKWQCKR